MEHLNDIGITLEILGFVIFLFIPIRETFNLKLSSAKDNRISDKMDNNKVRGLGIFLVFFGLALQYNWIAKLF